MHRSNRKPPSNQKNASKTPLKTPGNEPQKKPGDAPPGSHIPPSPEQKELRCHCRPDQTPWWKIVLEVAGVGIGAVVAVIYLFQLKQMQIATTAATGATNAAVNSYEATVRPYLSSGIHDQVEEHPQNLKFNAVLKNFGTIPAERVEFEWVVVVNGIPHPGYRTERELPHTLSQGEDTQMVGEIGKLESPRVLDGTEPVVIYVTYSYNWRDKHETNCEKFKYYPPARSFMALGPICSPD